MQKPPFGPRTNPALLTLLTTLALALPWPTWAGGVVTSCTETNLRAAMAGGGLVTFTCDGTIRLSKVLGVTQHLVLDATGHSVVISGANTTRVFRVQTNIHFTARNLTIADGWHLGASGSDGSPAQPGQDGRGAGLLNTGGTVTLIDCTLTNHWVQGGNAGFDATYAGNTAPGGRGLGAALCNWGGVVNLINCTLGANRVVGGRGSSDKAGRSVAGAGGAGLGGALFSSGGEVNLARVNLNDNQAVGGKGRAVGTNYTRGGQGAGGAIYLTNSVLWLTSCALTSNRVAGGAPGAGEALGGALGVASQGRAEVFQTVFTGNQARGGQDSKDRNGGVGKGGAVFNDGRLDFIESTASGNLALGGGEGRAPGVGKGGGLFSSGKATINRCTFDRNEARGGLGETIWASWGTNGLGGGLYTTGTLRATNLTVFGNRAVGWRHRDSNSADIAPGQGRGGGIHVADGTALLVNATVARNEAVKTTSTNTMGQWIWSGSAGGIACVGGTLTLRNSIVGSNPAGSDFELAAPGTVIDGGYNLCSDNSAPFKAVGSLIHADPLLVPLATNGGPTATMALLWGSPAIDAVPSLASPGLDQRGNPRPDGAASDIGAFEASSVITPCSEDWLRLAVSTGGVVRFPSNCLISLNRSLVVTNSVFLDAAGHDVTLSGNNTVRLFKVKPSGTLRLQGLTLADGLAQGTNAVAYGSAAGDGRGGAILNNGGVIEATDCTFLRNRALGGEHPEVRGHGMGGSLFNASGAIRLTNVAFLGNITVGGQGRWPGDEGGDSLGGAVYNQDGSLLAVRCSFTTNCALPDAGTNRLHGSCAGGALCNAGGHATFIATLFDRQTAGGSGEGSSASGGAVYQSSGTLSLTDCYFRTNQAIGNRAACGLSLRGGDAHGGALDLASGLVSMTNCAFVANAARGGDEGDFCHYVGPGPGSGLGGAVCNAAHFVAVNCTYVGNAALGGSRTNLLGPSASGLGGAFYNVGGTTILTHVTIANNIARCDTSNPAGVSQGGGIWSSNGTVALRNSILADNRGGGNWFGTTLVDDGNNLSSDASCPLTAPGSLSDADPVLGSLADNGGPTPTVALFSGSLAVDAGNPAWCPAADQRGVSRPAGASCDIGAFEGSLAVPENSEFWLRLALSTGGVARFTSDTTLTLDETLVVRRDAVLDAAGHDVTLSGNNAVRLFTVNPGVKLTLRGLTLADGLAQGTNAATYGIVGGDARGGAILNNGGVIEATDCTFLRNRALGGKGGNGVHTPNAGYVAPKAGGLGMGGSLFNASGVIRLTNVAFLGNLARGGQGGTPDYQPSSGGPGGDSFGGAVFNQGGSILTVNGRFVTNSAPAGSAGAGARTAWSGVSSGGAFYNAGGDATFIMTLFDRQTAGGGGRLSDASGGAVYQSSGSLVLTECYFRTNQALGNPGHQWYISPVRGGDASGGALCVVSGTAAMSNCAFVANAAVGGSYLATGSGWGGAVYSAGQLTAVNCTYAGNAANEGTNGSDSPYSPISCALGGALYNAGGTAVLTHVTIANNAAVRSTLGNTYGLAQGGGIWSSNGTVILRNSILADNEPGGNWYGNNLVDEGNNLCSDASCPFTAPGSLNDTYAVLGPIADNGGLTPTMALGIGSPAVDAANPAWCLPTDQRGIPRPDGAACDIGAFEGAQLVPPGARTLGASNVNASSALLNATVNPNRSVTTAAFEWGTTTNYGNWTDWVSMGDGFDWVPISAGITGLSPNQTYHFRVVASNALGMSLGHDDSFTTPPTAPTVTPVAISSITITSAVFETWVNPGGANTYAGFVWHEIGLTNTQQLFTWGGSDNLNRLITIPSLALKPGTTYSVWALAWNKLGNNTSPVTNFTTLPLPSPGPATLADSAASADPLVSDSEETEALLHVERSAGGSSISLSFKTVNGRQYQVVFQNDLGGSEWQPLGAIHAGTGAPVRVTDPIDPRRQCYYRVLVLP